MTQKSTRGGKSNADAYMYLSILGAFMHDRNPIQALVGDIQHMMKVVANLNKTRNAAQNRIDQLQNQVTRVESQIATTNPKTTGSRFDKLR